MNFTIDVFFGVTILWALSTLSSKLAVKYNIEALKESGNYDKGGSPSVKCVPVRGYCILVTHFCPLLRRNWLLQTLNWCFLFLIMKTIMFAVVYFARYPLGYAAVWFFQPVVHNPHLELSEQLFEPASLT